MKLVKALKKLLGLEKGEVKTVENNELLDYSYRIATEDEGIEWNYNRYGVRTETEYTKLSIEEAYIAPKRRIEVVKFDDCLEARNYWIHKGCKEFNESGAFDNNTLDLTNGDYVAPHELIHHVDREYMPTTIKVRNRSSVDKDLKLIRIELESNDTAVYVYAVA